MNYERRMTNDETPYGLTPPGARRHERMAGGIRMPASSIVQRGLAVGMLLASPAFAQQHEHGTSTTEKLGAVSFSTSCSPAAQPLFNRAVALLHSFEFAHAIEGFNTTLKTIPRAPWRNGALRSAAGVIRSRRAFAQPHRCSRDATLSRAPGRSDQDATRGRLPRRR